MYEPCENEPKLLKIACVNTECKVGRYIVETELKGHLQRSWGLKSDVHWACQNRQCLSLVNSLIQVMKYGASSPLITTKLCKTSCSKGKAFHMHLFMDMQFQNYTCTRFIDSPWLAFFWGFISQQWVTFARQWWIYDARWQCPFKSAPVLIRYLQGRHKPIFPPQSEYGPFR